MKQNNYNEYWKRWNVLQSAKIDLDLLAQDGWDVYDINLNNSIATVAKLDSITLRVDYMSTGGVSKITVKEGEGIVYQQQFNFLLKPSVAELEKILTLMKIKDWRKYYTAC